MPSLAILTMIIGANILVSNNDLFTIKRCQVKMCLVKDQFIVALVPMPS